jgi:hypothetical protein
LDGTRFDSLVRQLSIGQIGRRQFVARSLGIGVGLAVTTKTVLAQDSSTPESDMLQGADNGPLEQTFPCPLPGDPWNWLCGSGPYGPWYPILAPSDLTAASGIRWYGVDLDAEEGLAAVGFDQDGQEVSRFEARAGDVGQRWFLSDASTRIDGRLSIDRTSAGEINVSGNINDSEFGGALNRDGPPDPSLDGPIEIDPDQQRLLAQWQPVVRNFNGLLDIGFVSDGGPVQASGKGCFVAGFVLSITWAGCFAGPAGCVPAAAAGGYIANNCTSSW